MNSQVNNYGMKARKRFKRRVTYNCMGEKHYEEYEEHDYSISSFSSTVCENLKASEIKRKISSKNSTQIVSVPAIVVSLPEGILEFIPGNTPLLTTWSMSMSYWLHAAVTVSLCRHFLDLRMTAQHRALRLTTLEKCSNNQVIDDTEVVERFRSLSLHKMLVDFYSIKYGSNDLPIAQHRVVVFLEACAQYCHCSSVVNIVKHILLPDSNDEDELSELSVYLLIEARFILFRRGLVSDGQELSDTAVLLGYDNTKRTVEKHNIISKSSAENVAIELLSERGCYGPQFINLVLDAISRTPKAVAPQLSQDLPSTSSKNINNTFEDSSQIYYDLEDYLLVLAKTFVSAERTMRVFENRARQILDMPKINSNQTTGLFFLMKVFVSNDPHRTGLLSKSLFADLLQAYLPSSAPHISKSEVLVIVSAATRYLSRDAAEVVASHVSYVDFIGTLVSFCEQHRLTSSSSGILNISVDNFVLAMEESKINFENKHVETIMNYISTITTASALSPLWLCAREQPRQMLPRAGNWINVTSRDHLTKIDDLLGIESVPETITSRKNRQKKRQGIKLNSPTKIDVENDPMRLTGVATCITRNSSIRTNELIDVTLKSKSSGLMHAPRIWPTRREICTAHGEICKPMESKFSAPIHQSTLLSSLNSKLLDTGNSKSDIEKRLINSYSRSLSALKSDSTLKDTVQTDASENDVFDQIKIPNFHNSVINDSTDISNLLSDSANISIEFMNLQSQQSSNGNINQNEVISKLDTQSNLDTNCIVHNLDTVCQASSREVSNEIGSSVNDISLIVQSFSRPRTSQDFDSDQHLRQAVKSELAAFNEAEAVSRMEIMAYTEYMKLKYGKRPSPVVLVKKDKQFSRKQIKHHIPPELPDRAEIKAPKVLLQSSPIPLPSPLPHIPDVAIPVKMVESVKKEYPPSSDKDSTNSIKILNDHSSIVDSKAELDSHGSVTIPHVGKLSKSFSKKNRSSSTRSLKKGLSNRSIERAPSDLKLKLSLTSMESSNSVSCMDSSSDLYTTSSPTYSLATKSENTELDTEIDNPQLEEGYQLSHEESSEYDILKDPLFQSENDSELELTQRSNTTTSSMFSQYIVSDPVAVDIPTPRDPIESILEGLRVVSSKARRGQAEESFYVPQMFSSDINYNAFTAQHKMNPDHNWNQRQLFSDNFHPIPSDDHFSDIAAAIQQFRQLQQFDNIHSQKNNSFEYEDEGEAEIVPMYVKDFIQWRKFFSKEKDVLIRPLQERVLEAEKAFFTSAENDNDSLQVLAPIKGAKPINVKKTKQDEEKKTSLNRIIKRSVNQYRNPLALANGKIFEYSLDPQSQLIFQIFVEKASCTVTIEIACTKGFVELMMKEGDIPTLQRYDYVQTVSPLSSRSSLPTQITFRPKVGLSVMYFVVRSIGNSDVTSFKIWGFSSIPATKYGGSSEIDRIISRLEELAHHSDSKSQSNKSNITSGIQNKIKPREIILSRQENITEAKFSDDQLDLDAVVSRMGLTSLRELRTSSRGIHMNRNSHELLF